MEIPNRIILININCNQNYFRRKQLTSIVFEMKILHENGYSVRFPIVILSFEIIVLFNDFER